MTPQIPACFVIISSYLTETVIRLSVSEEDRLLMKADWHSANDLITRLNHLPWLERATTWADLDRAQIQALMALHLKVHIEEPNYDLASWLKTAITALIVNLEQDTGWVPLLRINHLGPLHVECDASLTIGVKLEALPLKTKPRFRVVVDNAPLD